MIDAVGDIMRYEAGEMWRQEMRWSNHAETRSSDGLGPEEIALGYLEQANKVLSGEMKLGDNDEERRSNLRKAHNILNALHRPGRLHAAKGVVWFGSMRVGGGK